MEKNYANIEGNAQQFFKLIRRQFEYGGQKYAHSGKKESTDVLFDDFGKNWLFGTIAKYVKRYSNVAREKDLLKIACYMFILWLKRGFHLQTEGTKEIINTAVDTKLKYFPTFLEQIKYFIAGYNFVGEPLTEIYNILHNFGDVSFDWIAKENLFEIFALANFIWEKDIKNKGTDEDVYNEDKNKERKKNDG